MSQEQAFLIQITFFLIHRKTNNQYRVSMQYYVIEKDRFNDKIFGYAEKFDDFNTGDAQTCDVCGGYISMLEWLEPYEMELSKNTLGDFIYGTITSFLCSKKVKDMIEKNNLTGVSSFNKVDLYYKKTLQGVSYYYTQIDIIRAFINPDYIEYKRQKTYCPGCQYSGSLISKINSVVFQNPEKITKDIFFTIAFCQGFIFVSERFKKLAEEHALTNIKFIKVEDFKYDFYKFNL